VREATGRVVLYIKVNPWHGFITFPFRPSAFHPVCSTILRFALSTQLGACI
jgi:hypothetical protein